MSDILIHFATGVACVLAPAAAVMSICRRGWSTLPLLVTFGGVWALIPTIVDAASQSNIGPIRGLLGNNAAVFLTHDLANLFFFHRSVRLQPIDLTIPALLGVIAVYAGCAVRWHRRRSRNPRSRRKRREITSHEVTPFTPIDPLPRLADDHEIPPGATEDQPERRRAA